MGAQCAQQLNLSGDHEMRRAINTDRSPKSVSGRIGPPSVGNAQMFVVVPSKSGIVSHLPSGDRTA